MLEITVIKANVELFLNICICEIKHFFHKIYEG